LAVQTRFDLLRVVLVATRNPLNLGAAARAMSNFGFARLRVVNPYQVAFREARSAVGASQVLKGAEEYGTVAEAVADCALVVGTTAVGHRELQHPLRRLEDGARVILKQLGRQQLGRKQAGSSRVALVFGSEKVGLSNEDFSHCHWLLHIPTSEENISMNLGQAVAVCLYELVRDAKVVRPAEKQAVATAGEIERITEILRDAMYASGYLKRRPTRDAEQRVRRLVRRLGLPARDVGAWLGILRQILWKLRNPESPAR
jgi:TrmH family RNA methyltransferase